MKKSVLLVLGMISLLILSSCNEDKIISNNQLVRSISVAGQDFLDGDAVNGTRAAYTVDGTGFHFTWTQGDTVGIYPVGGDQVAFPISSGEGSQIAQFDGGAWALRSSYSYAAYYPFSSGNYHIDETKLPVSFIGQTQNGNASLAALDRFDYQASSATRPDADGNVFISLKHLGCFVRFQLTMPVADTYKSITLQSSKTPFVTSGTYDLTKETVAITPITTSSSITIELNNTSTTADNKVLTIYAMVAPADLSFSEITITVTGTTYQSYTAKVNGKNMQAGKAYSYSATFKSGTNINGSDVEWDDEGNEILPQYEYVDLGLSVNWATFNVGAKSPEEYGNYYQWGDNQGYGSDVSDGKYFGFKDSENNNSYKWAMGSSNSLTKYCYDSRYGYNGFVDNKFVLDLCDDAAYNEWGEGWRMPTIGEIQELLDNSTITSETKNGISGLTFTSIIVGYTDKSIFIPCAGSRYQDTKNTSFRYWSSTASQAFFAYSVRLASGNNSEIVDNLQRYWGAPIRPVYDPVGHQSVDLGLSVKWATCNVGASKPEAYGYYFSWGDIVKPTEYSWPCYRHSSGNYDGTTVGKYKTDINYSQEGWGVDNKTVLEPQDDAATVNWGGSWRMPTTEEWNELINNCNWTWTNQNGINGYKVSSKTNGNFIFLPVAGFKNENGLNEGKGQYWSSSVDTNNNTTALSLLFYNGNYCMGSISRFMGQSVRPVCP